MKTPMRFLKKHLDKKILPCSDENSFVRGMNIAHENLLHYLHDWLLEWETELMIKVFLCGFGIGGVVGIMILNYLMQNK